MHAVRNIRLCTKDCLCLYVCPTGATDTETGQIDPTKCIDGCRKCVDACPSHAIFLVPDTYPPQQKKSDAVIAVLQQMATSKTAQSLIAEKVALETPDKVIQQLAKAIRTSNDLMTEDLLREAGYMLPQSDNAIDLLKSLLEADEADDFPRETVKKLIVLMGGTVEAVPENERYQCGVCGYILEGVLTEDFKCPVCQQPASVFKKID